VATLAVVDQTQAAVEVVVMGMEVISIMRVEQAVLV